MSTNPFAYPNAAPDQAGLQDALGAAYPVWLRLAEDVAALGFAAELSWAYYRDGGWLCRVRSGAKNLAWCAIWDGYFTVGFFCAERHRAALQELPLTTAALALAREAPTQGRMLALRLEIREAADLTDVGELLRFRKRAR